MMTVKLHWQIVCQFLKGLNTEPPQDPAIGGMYPKLKQLSIPRSAGNTDPSIAHYSAKVEQPNCSTDAKRHKM